MFTINSNNPKFIKSKNRLLKEILFAEGISNELKERIALHETNLEIMFSEFSFRDSSSLIVFAEDTALEKLWKEVRNPQKQIAFVEALSNLPFEAAMLSPVRLGKEKKGAEKFIKKMKECAEILGENEELKRHVNQGLERMFTPLLPESPPKGVFSVSGVYTDTHKKHLETWENLIRACVSKIADNPNITNLASKGVFSNHDYFTVFVFSLIALINLEIGKESFVDLKTNKSKRRTAYLNKKTKELLQQAGLTKSIDLRTEEVMEAMGWKEI